MPRDPIYVINCVRTALCMFVHTYTHVHTHRAGTFLDHDRDPATDSLSQIFRCYRADRSSYAINIAIDTNCQLSSTVFNLSGRGEGEGVASREPTSANNRKDRTLINVETLLRIESLRWRPRGKTVHSIGAEHTIDRTIITIQRINSQVSCFSSATIETDSPEEFSL